MKKVIRNADGTMPGSSLWKALKASGTHAAAKLLSLPPPPDRIFRDAWKKSKTRTTLMSAYPKEYREIRDALEKEQPTLQFCSYHWKADYLISSRLLSANRKKSKTSRKEPQNETINSAPEDDDELQPQVQPTPRSRSSPQKRQRASTTSTDNANKRPRLTMPPSAVVTNQPAPPEVGPQVGNSAETRHTETNISGLRAPLPVTSFVQPVIAAGSSIPTSINISFIKVDPSLPNLLRILEDEFKDIPLGPGKDLLEAMALNPAFCEAPSSPDILEFIQRIESANPNAPDLDEDQLGQNWGHNQLTSGSLTCSNVLKSWELIGSVRIASQVIAVIIKTCKVARHLCLTSGISPSTYLADAFLRNAFEMIWKAWKDAKGPLPARLLQSAPSADQSQPEGSTTGRPSDEKDLHALLKGVTKAKLLEWIAAHDIQVTMKQPKVKDLVELIIAAGDPALPSNEDIASMKPQRKRSQKS